MYTKNNGSGENNVIQNRFTAYLLTAIHRKKAAYLGACSRRREMELPTDPDDIVSVLDAMVNSAGDAPSPFPLFENDALEEALQKLSQRDRYIFLAHALYQRDFGDLASELGLTYQGAATAYHRARKKIKDTWEERQMSFKDLLIQAKDGSHYAQEKIFLLYRPLLFKEACVYEVFDEDLFQELSMTLVDCIRLFQL